MNVDMKLGDTKLILKECRRSGLTAPHTAYILATALHETAHTMKPVREAFWLSEGWRSNNLRYYPWYGRGYVQLTWEYNYRRATKEIGVDLIANPDSAMNPKNAAKILVIGCVEGWFTGKKLSDYSNYADMRIVVNGTDDADLIASIAEKYETELHLSENKVGFLGAALGFIMRMFKR